MSESPVSQVYRSCIQTLGDAEYCSSVVDAVIQALTTRIYSYPSQGHAKTKFFLVLSPDVEYTTSVLVDADKRAVVLWLRAPNHSVSLVFGRSSDGSKAVLSGALVHNLELIALQNPPLIPKK